MSELKSIVRMAMIPPSQTSVPAGQLKCPHRAKSVLNPVKAATGKDGVLDLQGVYKGQRNLGGGGLQAAQPACLKAVRLDTP